MSRSGVGFVLREGHATDVFIPKPERKSCGSCLQNFGQCWNVWMAMATELRARTFVVNYRARGPGAQHLALLMPS